MKDNHLPDWYFNSN